MLRGVHVDCRAQKLKASALLDILKDLAGWGYNAILLEYMDAFPFEGELACLKAPDAFTKEEVIQIRETAKSLGIEIIPLVQTFGHLYWVLRHPEFMPLAEGYDPERCAPEDVTNPDGTVRFTTICPTHPGSIALVKEMLRQTRELHPDSRYFHIGGDEIRRPSCPRCEEALKTRSLSELLAGHYTAVADAAIALGVTPIVWCDILMAFPETLDLMKGKVAVMDWDYWSNGQSTAETNLWGIRDLAKDNPNIAHEPDKWPELQQKLLRPYVFDKEPDTFRAFPYTDLFRDLGFEVILAGAARSAGDSFCVPSDMHLANSGAAADKAAASGITGYVITSWAVRRQPWPMTEISLMLASAHASGCKDDKATSLAFAKRHFGVEDEDLADLPRLLGFASKASENGTNVLQALNEKSDFRTGNFFGPGYNCGNPTWHILPRNIEVIQKADQFLSGMKNLKAACQEARARLTKADPEGAYTYLWYWAVDVLELYTDAAPLLVQKKLESAEDLALQKSLLDRVAVLTESTRTVFSRWYTDFTVEGELQTRFTVLKDALEERISGI